MSQKMLQVLSKGQTVLKCKKSCKIFFWQSWSQKYKFWTKFKFCKIKQGLGSKRIGVFEWLGFLTQYFWSPILVGIQSLWKSCPCGSPILLAAQSLLKLNLDGSTVLFGSAILKRAQSLREPHHFGGQSLLELDIFHGLTLIGAQPLSKSNFWGNRLILEVSKFFLIPIITEAQPLRKSNFHDNSIHQSSQFFWTPILVRAQYFWSPVLGGAESFTSQIRLEPIPFGAQSLLVLNDCWSLMLLEVRSLREPTPQVSSIPKGAQSLKEPSTSQ